MESRSLQGREDVNELVVVIVILGILAAVAVPKFVDMQDDAKRAAVEGARGSVRSAVSLIHSKFLVGGNSAATSVVAEGATINLAFGYPASDSILEAAGLQDDFQISSSGAITRAGEDPANAGVWSFTYSEATAENVPPVVGAPSKTAAAGG